MPASLPAGWPAGRPAAFAPLSNQHGAYLPTPAHLSLSHTLSLSPRSSVQLQGIEGSDEDIFDRARDLLEVRLRGAWAQRVRGLPAPFHRWLGL